MRKKKKKGGDDGSDSASGSDYEKLGKVTAGMEGGLGCQCTSPQSFITMFSYSLP